MWRYGLKNGSLDVDDKSVVEIYVENDDGEYLVHTYSNVIRVGDVCEHTTMCMPEKTISRCPRCGYAEQG